MTDLHIERPIFLIGMMGAGKSTVGALLATRLGTPFVDLDSRIERLFGAAIAELFAEGESAFRARESAALLSLADEPGCMGRRCVVATGGGVVLSVDNQRWMAAHGHMVYLQVGIETLCARLTSTPNRRVRPLLGARIDLRDTLGRLLEERRSRYEACETIVDAQVSPELVVASVIESLGPWEGSARRTGGGS